MRDDLREKLNTEITRKQFLQYMTAAVLMIFGLNNLIALLTGSRPDQHLLPPAPGEADGFGSRRFGT